MAAHSTYCRGGRRASFSGDSWGSSCLKMGRASTSLQHREGASGQEQGPLAMTATLGDVDADHVPGSPAKHTAESWVSFPRLPPPVLSERANHPAITLLSLDDPEEIYSIKSLVRGKCKVT